MRIDRPDRLLGGSPLWNQFAQCSAAQVLEEVEFRQLANAHTRKTGFQHRISAVAAKAISVVAIMWIGAFMLLNQRHKEVYWGGETRTLDTRIMMTRSTFRPCRQPSETDSLFSIFSIHSWVNDTNPGTMSRRHKRTTKRSLKHLPCLTTARRSKMCKPVWRGGGQAAKVKGI